MLHTSHDVDYNNGKKGSSINNERGTDGDRESECVENAARKFSHP